MNNIELWQGNCFELLKNIPDKSVGFICVDLPYSTTAASYDKELFDLDRMWVEVKRVLMPDRCAAMFSSGSFTYRLVSSNIDWFKYDIIWVKSRKGNFVNAFNKPLSQHEKINIFSDANTANGSKLKMLYNPQGLQPCHKEHSGLMGKTVMCGARPSHKEHIVSEWTNFPSDVWTYDSSSGIAHPNAKPVPLLENLIRTYSNEGDLVLDFCMGSGTAGVASVKAKRSFIGIELDPKYFELAKGRIETEQSTLKLF